MRKSLAVYDQVHESVNQTWEFLLQSPMIYSVRSHIMLPKTEAGKTTVQVRKTKDTITNLLPGTWDFEEIVKQKRLLSHLQFCVDNHPEMSGWSTTRPRA
jgi:hypothetical protein